MAEAKVLVDCRRIDCIGELMQPIAAGAITRSDIAYGHGDIVRRCR